MAKNKSGVWDQWDYFMRKDGFTPPVDGAPLGVWKTAIDKYVSFMGRRNAENRGANHHDRQTHPTQSDSAMRTMRTRRMPIHNILGQNH